MLKHKFLNFHSTTQTLIPLHNSTFLSVLPNHAASSFLNIPPKTKIKPKQKLGILRPVKAVWSSTTEKSTTVTAVITVLQTVGGALTHLGLSRALDDLADALGRTFLLELVAAQLDPSKQMHISCIFVLEIDPLFFINFKKR